MSIKAGNGTINGWQDATNAYSSNNAYALENSQNPMILRFTCAYL